MTLSKGVPKEIGKLKIRMDPFQFHNDPSFHVRTLCRELPSLPRGIGPGKKGLVRTVLKG